MSSIFAIKKKVGIKGEREKQNGFYCRYSHRNRKIWKKLYRKRKRGENIESKKTYREKKRDKNDREVRIERKICKRVRKRE